jgi:hypothetical protein
MGRQALSSASEKTATWLSMTDAGMFSKGHLNQCHYNVTKACRQPKSTFSLCLSAKCITEIIHDLNVMFVKVAVHAVRTSVKINRSHL